MSSTPAAPPASGASGVVSPGQVNVTIQSGGGNTALDLSQILSDWEGWQYQDPPQLRIIGNSNRTLVNTRLTDTDLQVSSTGGQGGAASVTVGLTDAAGNSTHVTFLITVTPLANGVAQAGSLKLPFAANPLAD
jgi:hypothetical protein